jgi:hypothetical protein
MIIEIAGYFDSDMRIMELNGEKLAPMRAAHKPGETLRIIFDDSIEGEHGAASRYFHKIRDRYAQSAGLDYEEAKLLCKYRHGPTEPFIPGSPPPTWGREIFEIYTNLLYIKSTVKYTTEEWNKLIEGTIRDCMETPGCDLSDIIGGR